MLSALRVLAQQAEPVILRVDHATRVKILLALTAVVVLGITAVFLIWLTGRAVRRYSSYQPTREIPPVEPDDWAHTPLVPPLQDSASSDES